MTICAMFGPRRPSRGVVLALAALILAPTAGAAALTQALARSRPDIALRLDQGNPVALATAFDQAVAAGGMNREQLTRWAARGRKALRGEPLAAAMVRLASLDPALSPGRSAALLTVGERLSRRDALTQLALIEAAAQAGRIDLALAHYDRALSIHASMREILFPVLTGALAVPEVRLGVAELALRARPWMEPFVAFAVQQPNAADSIADLLARIDRDGSAWPLARRYESVLAGQQANRGKYAAAMHLARRAIGPGAAVLERLDFSPPAWAESLRPLTWTSGDAQGATADPDDNGTVIVTVGAGGSGRILTRVLVPAPGSYRLFADTAAAVDVPAAAGRWVLTCLAAGGRSSSPLTDLEVEPARSAQVAVTVPDGCAAVRIDFVVDNANGAGDAALVLRRLALIRTS